MKIDNKLITVGIIIAVMFLILCALLIGFGGNKNTDSSQNDLYVRCAAESSSDRYQECQNCIDRGYNWMFGYCDYPGYSDGGKAT